MILPGRGTTGAYDRSANGCRGPSAAPARARQSALASSVPTSLAPHSTASSPSIRTALIPDSVLIVASLIAGRPECGTDQAPRRSEHRRTGTDPDPSPSPLVSWYSAQDG